MNRTRRLRMNPVLRDMVRENHVRVDELIYPLFVMDGEDICKEVPSIGEMLRLPIAGYEIVEYSHGPTMALNKKQTLFMIGSDEKEFEQMIIYRQAFKNYTDRVHVITCRELDEKDDRDLVFSVKTNKYLAPLMYTVPFQFVAAKGAKDIGIDTAINPFKIRLAHY